MDRPTEVFQYVVGVLERLELPYAVGGSFASSFYGVPRFTNDLDIIVELPAERVSSFVAHFTFPEFYVDPQVARQAVAERGQFNIIHPNSGFKVDVYVPGDDIARGQISRSRRVTTPDGITAEFSSPEELIVKKLQFYAWGGMDTQIRDIVSMLQVLGSQVDRERVRGLAEQTSLLPTWEIVLNRLQ